MNRVLDDDGEQATAPSLRCWCWCLQWLPVSWGCSVGGFNPGHD